MFLLTYPAVHGDQGCQRPQAGGLQRQKAVFPQSWQLDVRVRSCRMDFWWERSSWLVDGHLLSVPSHRLLSLHTWREREGTLWRLFLQGSNFCQGSTLMTSSTLNYFYKGPSPNTVTLGIRASVYEFGGTQSVHHKHLLSTSNTTHKVLATMTPTFLWGLCAHACARVDCYQG